MNIQGIKNRIELLKSKVGNREDRITEIVHVIYVPGKSGPIPTGKVIKRRIL